MEFSIKNVSLEKDLADCLIVGVYENESLSESAQTIDIAANDYIKKLIKTGDVTGKLATTVMLHHIPKIASKRVLLVGLGQQSDFTAKKFKQAVRAALQAVIKHAGITKLVTTLATLNVEDLSVQKKVDLLSEAMLDAAYQVNAIKQKKEINESKGKKVAIHVLANEIADAKLGLMKGQAVAKGMNLTKDLGNLAPNICTPTYLADAAQKMGKEYGFKVKVLEEADVKKLGMGSFLGVTKGSSEPAKFIIMEYKKGKKDQKPVVLVGKGITFDTGGISLKPGAAMDEMKYDMGGAASVLGTFKAIAEMQLSFNVVGLIPTCENMPDGTATKPGDILTSMSGLTIEVLNTDAEGRLILCDALTYAEKFDPSAVVDVATLTGACVVALGHHATAVYSNQDTLAQELIDAGEKSLDRGWHMPMWDDYQSQLDSNFADIANIGGRDGGSITAACFLSRFAKSYNWAHLDIAGTAWHSGKNKGSTGRPVPLLTEFLVSRASQA
jgi:leucyl aminopeptidase